MSENLRFFTKALYGFDHVVRLVPPDAWQQPSPCPGWTARHVLGHVNAIQRYLITTIRGEPPTMNPMEDPDRHAGDEPAATWAATRDVVLEAVDHGGVLHHEVESFWGTIEVDAMLGFNVADTTVHSWDLARAAGVDDRLDPTLVDRSLELMAEAADGLRSRGMLGPAVSVDADAPLQNRLLGIVGRHPDNDQLSQQDQRDP